MPGPIDKWIICISGFLQNEGRPTGVVGLWRELRRFADPTVCVELRSWDANVADLAELIWRCQPAASLPRIVVAAYSWGGATAINLAWQLKRRGLPINQLVLADAVTRHRYWFGQWRAFLPWVRLHIPPNVQHVHQFRQRTSWPRGHDVCATGTTVLHLPVWLDVDHVHMDDAGEFHEKVLGVAA